MTVEQVAIAVIPFLLGIIGFFILRALKLYDNKVKSYDDRLEANTNMMGVLSDSINLLRLEISKVSLNADQQRIRCDERMSAVYGHLTENDNILEKHADWLQRHEIEITKLQTK